MANERQRVKELERLSAYLDGQLNPADQQLIESRLVSEPELHEMYEGLRKTKLLFSRLRRVRAPRSFVLTPEMVKTRKQKRSFFTGIRWATSAAAILLVVLFGAEYLLGNTFAARAPMASEPVLESVNLQDTDASADEAPEEKAAESPEPLIFWGGPGAGGGGDAEAYGLGGGGDTGMLYGESPLEPSGGGEIPPETQPIEPSPELRTTDDTEGESLILGINTDQVDEEQADEALAVREEAAKKPFMDWLAALSPLRWVEIGLAILTLTGVIILLVRKKP